MIKHRNGLVHQRHTQPQAPAPARPSMWLLLLDLFTHSARNFCAPAPLHQGTGRSTAPHRLSLRSLSDLRVLAAIPERFSSLPHLFARGRFATFFFPAQAGSVRS